MAISSANAAAAPATRRVETLTSGTSWTVPAGVTYVNATLAGGGGGGGSGDSGTQGACMPGDGGNLITTLVTTTPAATITYAIGAGGAGGAGNAAGDTGGTTTFTGATSATGGVGGRKFAAQNASNRSGIGGAINGGQGASAGNSTPYTGGNGGSGYIILEYWVQETTMKTFAVIENNKVVNIIVGVEDEVVAANPNKYIEYTNGWDYNNGIDGGDFFPVPVTE